jgi:hypothetical protein
LGSYGCPRGRRQRVAWESAWRSGSFPPTLARGWNRRSERLAWETKLVFKNPPQITFHTPPTQTKSTCHQTVFKGPND